MSNISECVTLRKEIRVRGPTGETKYSEKGLFITEGKQACFDRVTLILGGFGITSGY